MRVGHPCLKVKHNVPVQAMIAHVERRGTEPLIINLCIKFRWVISFTLQPLSPAVPIQREDGRTPEANLTLCRSKQSLVLAGNRASIPWSSSPYHSHYTDCTILPPATLNLLFDSEKIIYNCHNPRLFRHADFLYKSFIDITNLHQWRIQALVNCCAFNQLPLSP
jgi:hypothetical protein